MANGADWFYMAGDQRNGPITATELKQLVRVGKIGPDDPVWKEGMAEWQAASKVKGLFPSAAGSDSAGQAGAASAGPNASASANVQSVLSEGVATAGRMMDQVSRFGGAVHNISSTLFEGGEVRDDHPAIFVRSKYFGGCIQKGIPPSILNSLGSTILAVLFSWLYLGLILHLMGAAWQFLPFNRTEFLSVRLRRRVRPAVIVPVVITWAVQLFVGYFVLFIGFAVAAGMSRAVDSDSLLQMASLACAGLIALWGGICNYTALKILRGLEPDTMFDFQAILEYGYPRKVALIRGTSGVSMEQQLEGVLTLCEQLANVEFGRWDQVTTHGREGIVGGIWSRVQNLGS